MFLTAGLMLTSCSSDDDNNNDESNGGGNGGNVSGKLEGKWIPSQYGESLNTLEVYEHSEGCAKDYVEVIAGGILKDVYYEEETCEKDENTLTWTRSGNIFTFGDGEDVIVTEIISLTNKELILKIIDIEDLEGANHYTVFTRG